MHEAYKSSGLKAVSAVIKASAALLGGLMVEGDGTNPATAIVYDNASAGSGTELAKVIVDGGLTYEGWVPSKPIAASNGLYLTLSGTGAKAIVHYR